MLNIFRAPLTLWMAWSVAGLVIAEENLIDFESAEIGKPTVQWEDKGVVFELAHAPTKSKAKGRVMFFPHLGTQRKGILNAMANEAIPVRVTFPRPAETVKLTLWGSTTSAALVEAFDAEGNLIAQAGLDQVPVRKRPEEHIPFFDLSVSAKHIAYLHISGSQPGGFVAVDELRWSYPAAPATAVIRTPPKP
ncbi:MAG: hypothetical protein R3C53_06725 [Pirellulaceae bacterium]